MRCCLLRSINQPPSCLTRVRTALLVQQVAYGVICAPGGTERFKSARNPSKLESVTVLGASNSGSAAEDAVAQGVVLAKGNLFARGLVEAPPNFCSPTYLAEAAAEIAKKFPERLTLEVLEKEKCEELQMGCYLAVAQVRSLAHAWAEGFSHLVADCYVNGLM
jgi:leucyl aminopeptidase